MTIGYDLFPGYTFLNWHDVVCHAIYEKFELGKVLTMAGSFHADGKLNTDEMISIMYRVLTEYSLMPYVGYTGVNSTIPTKEAMPQPNQVIGEMDQIYVGVGREVLRQNAKWGEQNHSHLKWSAILTEETGEVAKAALEENAEQYITELIHVAAVAFQAIASHARQNGKR
ncbi:MAG: MazG-like family protein [Patescibacteria group bacterium]|jgi:NTP pyrophosphatase (non-canonical NTP hydrolase)